MEDNDLEPCPHCGDSEDGFYVNAFWYGSVQRYYRVSGEHDTTDVDKLKSKTSNVVRCARCMKIRRDVQIIDDKIIKSPKEG